MVLDPQLAAVVVHEHHYQVQSEAVALHPGVSWVHAVEDLLLHVSRHTRAFYSLHF
jgi:hypothetical protein